jgi:hypothetical protein
MATERALDTGDQLPNPDDLDPPVVDGDDELPFTAEDIAHLMERLEAGRDSGEYTGMRESDLTVLAHLSIEQWHDVRRDPSLLLRLVTPTAHA